MRWVFWASVALLAYTYIGYAGWLWLRVRMRPRPLHSSPCLPSVSIVMVVRNETAVLERKLRNLLALNYPPELCEIVVVSDGSTDETNNILTSCSAGDPRIRIVLNHQSRGKASGLNEAIAAASCEIVVFTDARQEVDADAIRALVANFGDPQVGCASGELMLGDPHSGEHVRGMGLYWRIEKSIREMESASGSVVGATGALYAVRRNLLVSVPGGTILDDVYIPMHVVRQGFRVIFAPEARAWDVADQGAEREFSRKVRTLSGNYQLVQFAPWLLSNSNPLRFEFISHKLLRLIAPMALAVALVASFLLPQPFFRIVLAIQLMFYGLSVLAMTNLPMGPLARVADAARTFVVLNIAALVACAKVMTGRSISWNPKDKIEKDVRVRAHAG